MTLAEKGTALVEHSIRVAKALDRRAAEILGASDLAKLKTLLVRIQEADGTWSVSHNTRRKLESLARF